MDATNMKMFKSEIVNLSDLDKYSFTIPTYQRPYVWGDEQLKKLLDDFFKSFSTNPESAYYISTILTKEYGDLAEVIDGQQRFTTLWLISFVMSKIIPQTELVRFLKNGEKLRLGFEIREEVTEFLNDLLEEDKTAKKIYDKVFIDKYPYLKNIAKGLVYIKGYIEQLQLPQNKLEAFSNYIYHKVYLIKNTTPENTDLNKLFSTINSAGVQLEQTDIVKANLLNLIDNKVAFGKIWEACENMNNFFERNVRDSFSATNWHSVDLEDLKPFDQDVFKYEGGDESDTSTKSVFTIDDIEFSEIAKYEPPKKNSINEEDRNPEEIYCRSIINFGQLLLHTYRIHLKKEDLNDFEGTFHVNRLIEIFKSLESRNDSEEIKRFILLLWEVRYLFDKYVIKWMSDIDSKTESLELANFNRNDKSYYSRTKYTKSDSLMLQSVLYFTGDYLRQYWLSAYLDYLYYNHNNAPATSELHLKYLEKVDNVFSLNKLNTDMELSWMLMKQTSGFPQDINIFDSLMLSKGTGFKHYWFQKLEYVLWKNWEFEKTEEFNNYKISSKNSVEHVYPQQPDKLILAPEINDEYLHSFGNVVLLSVSQNSEYSNKSFGVKKSMFKEKRESYDTLKSYYIFNQNDEWNSDRIKQHRDEMIEKLLTHYNHGN